MNNDIKNLKYFNQDQLYFTLYNKSKSGNNFKKLFDRVIRAENILLALKNVKRYCVRHFTEEYDFYTNLSLVDLKQILLIRLDVYVNKFDFLDLLIQQMILQVLEPICEGKFNNHSYKGRPLRNFSHFIADVAHKMNIQKYRYVVKLDFSHSKLFFKMSYIMNAFWNIGIKDKKLLAILKSFIISSKDVLYKDIKLLSDLIINVSLTDFDCWISSQWENFITKHTYIGKNTSDNSKKYRALRENSKLKEMMLVRYGHIVLVFVPSLDYLFRIKKSILLWFKKRKKFDASFVISDVDLFRKNIEVEGICFKYAKKGKYKNGKTKFVMKSYLSIELLNEIKRQLQYRINNIAKNLNSYLFFSKLIAYNEYVLFIHSKYAYLTEINDDLNRIYLGLYRRMYNRFNKNNIIYFSRTSDISYSNDLYKKYYNSDMIRYVKGYPILPISYIQFKKPLLLKKDYFSIENVDTFNVKYEANRLLKSLLLMSDRSYQFVNSKVVKYIEQQGKCFITHQTLTSDNAVAHHVVPFKKSKDDSLANIVIINDDCHKLIHTVDDTIISKYMNRLNLDISEIKKINEFRILVGNKPISMIM